MSKVVSLIAGSVLGLIVIIMVLLLGSRSKAPTAPAEENLTVNVQQIQSGTQKAQSAGLENFGNLPVVITGDRIGRSNPFEAY